MVDDELTAEETLKLKMLEAAARRGSTDDELKYLLAAMNGENMVLLPLRGGQSVHVKVDRVRLLLPLGDRTEMSFTRDPYREKDIIIDMEIHKVRSRLLEAGWTG